LIFQVAHLFCAISCDEIQEILPMVSLARFPGQPPIVEGLFDLRGVLIPVVRMRHLLALPPAALGLYTPLIVFKWRQRLLALCVDRVASVEELDETTRRELAPSFSANDCAEAEYGAGDSGFVLFRTDRLFLAEESQRLEELVHEARRRIAEIEASRA
jgi:purine-binding chemotaxis protein CheW